MVGLVPADGAVVERQVVGTTLDAGIMDPVLEALYAVIRGDNTVGDRGGRS